MRKTWKIFQNSRKNLKLKVKTKKSAFFRIPGCRKSVQKKPVGPELSSTKITPRSDDRFTSLSLSTRYGMKKIIQRSDLIFIENATVSTYHTCWRRQCGLISFTNLVSVGWSSKYVCWVAPEGGSGSWDPGPFRGLNHTDKVFELFGTHDSFDPVSCISNF